MSKPDTKKEEQPAPLGCRDLLAELNYSDVDWVWVSRHWDMHLAGLCRYNGELCEFKADYETTKVQVFGLTPLLKFCWLVRKKLFEWMVGYHWTYPYRLNQLRRFGMRRPRWFWHFVFRAYYAVPRFWRRIFTANA